MTHSAMTSLLGPEFDAFLFASVDVQGNGGSVSVLSALARSGVDPWREAAELARMPREAARQRLAGRIEALVGVGECGTLIDRLVWLLPFRGRGSRRSPARSERGRRLLAIGKVILVNLLVMAGLLFAQWGLSGIRRPHAGMVRAVGARMVVATPSPAAGTDQ